jgi:hypothetical protein
MHSFARFRFAALGLVALAALLAAPGGALAAKPVFFTQTWDFTETVTDFCGEAGLTVEGHFTGQVDGQLRPAKEGEFPLVSAHAVIEETWTGPNGEVVTVSANRRERDLAVTDNGDGTYTVQVQVTGAFVTIVGPDGARSLDRGLAVAAIRWDFNGTPSDLTDDVFVGVEGILRTAGPHPDLLDGAFCTIAVAAFTA